MSTPADIVELWFLGYLLAPKRFAYGLPRDVDLHQHRITLLRTAPPIVRDVLERQMQRLGHAASIRDADVDIERIVEAIAKGTIADHPATARSFRQLAQVEVDRLVGMALRLEPDADPVTARAIVQLLGTLAGTGRDRLSRYHMRLYESKLKLPPVVWTDPDDSFRDHVIQDYAGATGPFVRTEPLEWIADERVCQALASGEINTTFEFPYLADQVGHLFYDTGEVIALYLEESYELIPADQARTVTQSPLAALVPAVHGEPFAAYLFDIDLTHEVAQPLGLFGTRLRIPFLYSHEPTYWQLGTDGVAGSIGFVPDAQDYSVEQTLVLGDERGSPYETARGVGAGLFSQFGGLPNWQQEPDYPACSECGELMCCIGQVDLFDNIRYGGNAYAFLCFDCEIAVTFVQID